MSLGTFVLCGLAFTAGVVCGVVLGNKGIVTTEDLSRTGRYITDTTKSVVNKAQGAVRPTPTPPA